MAGVWEDWCGCGSILAPVLSMAGHEKLSQESIKAKGLYTQKAIILHTLGPKPTKPWALRVGKGRVPRLTSGGTSRLTLMCSRP